MRWRKEGPYLALSDEGYKVARYRIAGVDHYRPSLQGSFISAPVSDPKEAQAACDQHFKTAKSK